MTTLKIQTTICSLESKFLKTALPIIVIGNIVKVGVKIIEGNKERIQYYAGTIIAKKNSSINSVFTVRKSIQGIGIERIFLVHSPKIESIVFLRTAKTRRAKLYYLRHLNGKAGRLKQVFQKNIVS